jgi:uridine phosphorylase
MTPTKDDALGKQPPILRCKNHRSPSVFTPEALLREARRQKGIDVGLLSHGTPYVRARGRGVQYGVVGCAVGAAFAVLVAEELFASGCKLLISITSAGQIAPVQAPPYFIVLDRALRDEGTSYHYLPPAEYSLADEGLVRLAKVSLSAAGITVQVGAAWTTDAPFRETAEAISAAKDAGILAVEMEAAALYAFAAARNQPVLCFAHVTNQMGRVEGDFEKGVADGAEESLNLISQVARGWRNRSRPAALEKSSTLQSEVAKLPPLISEVSP